MRTTCLLPFSALSVFCVALAGCGKVETPSAPNPEPASTRPPVVPLPKEKMPDPTPTASLPEVVPVTPADKAKLEATEKKDARVEGPLTNGGYQVTIAPTADAAEILALLKGTKCVVGLTIEGARLSDGSLKCLEGFDHLESLVLNQCDGLTGAEFGALARLSRLKTVSIVGSGTRLTDAGLRELAALPALDTISLDSVPISGRAFAAPGWAKLREISATNMPFDDAGLEAVAGLPVLESLDLRATKVTDAGVKHLERAKTLTYLVLDNTGVGDAGLVALGKLPALKELHLEETKITDTGVAALSSAGALRVLNLEKTAVTGSAFAKFPQLSALRKLSLSHTNFADANGPHLARFTALTTLSLTACPVSDAGLTSLAELKKLTSLNLTATKAGDGTAKLVRTLPLLEIATFDGTAITDAGLKDAAQGARLKFLYARGAKATKRGAAEAEKFAREGVKIVVE